MLSVIRPAVVGSCVAAVCLVGQARVSAQGAVAPASEYRAVLDQYCVTCHSDRLQTAGLTLESFEVEHVGRNAEVWEKVVRKLRTREMPPRPASQAR